MTHAALKDLLDKYDHIRDHVGGCSDGGCVVKRPVGMHTNGGCKCSTDRIKAQRMMYAGQWLRDQLSAALSAMEGEAVAWAVLFNGEKVAVRDLPMPVLAEQWTQRPLIYGDTAPPPQQAVVPALEVFRISGGDVECCPNPTADEAMECLRDLRECYNESLATRHTPSPEGKHRIAHTENGASVGPPSPGPQGGGEYWLNLYVGDNTENYAYRSKDAAINAGCPEEDGDRIAVHVREVATPPAHQPGEVVTDGMVDRYCQAAFGDLGWPHDFAPNAVATNRAMVRKNLTAALAPKEDGHDR